MSNKELNTEIKKCKKEQLRGLITFFCNLIFWCSIGAACFWGGFKYEDNEPVKWILIGFGIFSFITFLVTTFLFFNFEIKISEKLKKIMASFKQKK